MPALESVEKGGVSNHTEAALIHNLLSMLIKVRTSVAKVLIEE